MTIKRNRIFYILAVIVVIPTGLASRKFASHLPEIINQYLGDALWALMIYLILAFLFKNRSIKWVALYSILFCYMIETSQLYHAEWIDQIRNTWFGGLVLGFGFLWSDLLAYTIGVGFGAFAETLIKKHQNIG